MSAIALWLVVSWLTGPVQAQTRLGMPLPTPPGSTWTVLQGYNTPSHTGVDPFAIDLVRVDADSGGSPILAPVAGTVAFRSDDCLAIRDSAGHYILLCHILSTPGLGLGDWIERGDQIAIVKPPGPDEFWRAHLHFAVHRTLELGSGVDTIPFSGRYALEGRDLVETADPNAYGGLSFIASAGLLSLSGITFPDGFTHLTWQGGTIAPSDGFLPLLEGLEAVYAWSLRTRRYTVYRPAAPAFLTTLNAVNPGDLLWFRMTAARVWEPSRNVAAAAVP